MRATPSDGVRRDGGIAEIRRAADLFDLYSQPGHGTAVVVHISAQGTQDLESREREALRLAVGFFLGLFERLLVPRLFRDIG